MSRIDTGPVLNIHKLTNVEAQRIMLILEETFVKLSLLSYVPPGASPDDAVLPELVGPEIHQVLREQALLEQQYESVSNPGSSDLSHGLPDFETLDDELRHSSRVVARMLMEDRLIVDKIEAVMGGVERDVAMLKFLATFNELKHQAYQKMSTSVEEEKSKEDFYLEVSAREEKASQMLRALQKDLKAEKTEHETEVVALDETIAKLRNEIEHIRSSTAAEIKNLEDTTRTRKDDDKAAWESKDSSLSAEVERLRAELASTSQRDREAEEELRKKKVRYEGEVNNWINNYDKEMREKRGQIKAIRKEYDEEQKKIRFYEEYFQRVEAEKALRAAEQRKLDEEAAKVAAQRTLLNQSAIVFQRVCRGFLVRRQLDKAKKKGKKGKKKGKKGGKGKGKGKGKKK